MERQGSRGLTLIELLVGMSILALLMVMAAPSLGEWMTNARLRNTAEAISASLQFAKGEAVARNTRVRFQFTSTLDNACNVSNTGPHWVVNADPDANAAAVEGACDAALSDTTAPRMLGRHDARENGASTVIEASSASLVFNGLGRVTPVPAGNISIDVRSTDGSDCVANGGSLSCMRVLVSAVGQIRVCNPAISHSHPGAC